ncbi:hypothetical protein BDN67DRAFT_971963 [Paxillus ammoniavirescens]|nr:hypothetical protein BDN67DRAFT_971963 [Paxillus ammoniavirescens]
MSTISYPQSLPFPVEVICKILSFANALDIVRLRTVSKQFCDIVHDPQLWKTLYVNACVLRPPGPFPWQSIEFLERTLVQSEQLSRKWTSGSLKVTARALPSLNPTDWDLLFGRWLIWTDDTTNLRSHDLDTGAEQVLWQVEDSSTSSFAACPTTSVDGRMINIILYDVGDAFTVTNLLEYRVHEDSSSLSDAVSHGVPGLEGRFRTNGQAPYKFCFGQGNLIFDSKTGSFYKLPPYHSTLGPKVILTKTHVVAFYDLPSAVTLIRAFVVPDPLSPAPAHATVDELCLTHEAHMGEFLDPVILIRDSVFNTMTKSTNLRFLVGSYGYGQTYYRCLDLMLPEPSSSEGMSMSIHTQDLFSVDCISEPALAGGSDDGHVRGFVSRPTGDDHTYLPQEVISIQKFTIDASQERCTAVLGEPTPVTFLQNSGGISAATSEFTFARYMYEEFDPIRGRLCQNIDYGRQFTGVVCLDIE